jgi:molybdopterin converting factor small subunit
MSVTVKIPASLRNLAGGAEQVEVPPGRVVEVVARLSSDYPGLGERLIEAGKLRRFVNVFVGEEDVRFLDGLETDVAEGQVVTILPAVSGGGIQ